VLNHKTTETTEVEEYLKETKIEIHIIGTERKKSTLLIGTERKNPALFVSTQHKNLRTQPSA